MSGVMAFETLVRTWLEFQGYWTMVRAPFKKRSGAISDIDVLGRNARDQTVVAECKAWGSPCQDGNSELYAEGLRKEYGMPVDHLNVKGIHEVIQDLYNSVNIDMHERRKRYPDSALEMLRWMIRAGGRTDWGKQSSGVPHM
jgi:hypothetical protein